MIIFLFLFVEFQDCPPSVKLMQMLEYLKNISLYYHPIMVLERYYCELSSHHSSTKLPKNRNANVSYNIVLVSISFFSPLVVHKIWPVFSTSGSLCINGFFVVFETYLNLTSSHCRILLKLNYTQEFISYKINFNISL